VCVCVCLFVRLPVCPSVRKSISGAARPILAKFFLHVTKSRGSVFLWRRRDMLCISGFMNDATFAHNVTAYKATKRGRALKVTPQVAASGRSLQSTTALFAVCLFPVANGALCHI